MAYRFVGDELFDLLPADLREKTSNQRVVAADLGRLLAVREAIEEGFDTVIWCDADVLVFNPERLTPSPASFALGREVWVQERRGRPHAYVKVHNAFLMFRRSNPFLDYYLHVAQQLVREHMGPMVPQFVGPKLLAALHNVARFPVQESAGMLSPAVMSDVLRGGGPSLELFTRLSPELPAALNLCSSLVDSGETTDADVDGLVRVLLAGAVF